MPAYNATISGYVVCDSSGLTLQQAKDYIAEQQAAAKRKIEESRIAELKALGGDDCTSTMPGTSAETYFRRAKALMALQRYKDARACFLTVQELEKDSIYHNESCETLGLMYEIGLGVDKDMETAREWYRKAGLTSSQKGP